MKRACSAFFDIMTAMTKIKLISLDLDGTLLNREKKISAENLAALTEARAAGVTVILNTGRPLVSAQEYLNALGLTDARDYSIFLNGGLVLSADGEKLLEKNLTFDEVQEILSVAAALDLPADIISEKNSYTVENDRPSRLSYVNNTLTFQKTTADELTDDKSYNKLILSADKELLDTALAGFSADFLNKFEVVKTRDILMEIMPKGVTKGAGLAYLAGKLGISSNEILAMGDEDNDISMLEFAGYGTAPANANPKAKAAAKFVTDATNDENAVAEAVRKFVLNDEA